MPPTGAFWSVTLYNSDGFQVANSINRFAVSGWIRSRTIPTAPFPLHPEQSPGKDFEAIWLPPPTGPFDLTIRLYAQTWIP